MKRKKLGMEKTELINYYTGCRIIFSHYGDEHQRKQLIQELGELIVAITKNDLENIIEEMADVEVVLDQFKIAYPKISNKIDEVMLQKVKRQLCRIKTEKEKNQWKKH